MEALSVRTACDQTSCACAVPQLPCGMKHLLLATLLMATSAFAAHPVVCCDYGGDKVCILSADGKIEWQVEAKHPQDCWRLPNGNILFAYVNGAKEMTKDKQVVWEYRQDLKVKSHVKQKQKDGTEVEKDIEEGVEFVMMGIVMLLVDLPDKGFTSPQRADQ